MFKQCSIEESSHSISTSIGISWEIPIVFRQHSCINKMPITWKCCCNVFYKHFWRCKKNIQSTHRENKWTKLKSDAEKHLLRIMKTLGKFWRKLKSSIFYSDFTEITIIPGKCRMQMAIWDIFHSNSIQASAKMGILIANSAAENRNRLVCTSDITSCMNDLDMRKIRALYLSFYTLRFN